MSLFVRTEGRITSSGEAVARAPDGRVMFVRGAAPDERVEVRVIEERRRFVRAEVERVVEPGPRRVEPRCRHYGRCGGCALQHVDHPAQAELKVEAAVETLRRLGQLRLPPTEPPWIGSAYGTRGRVRWTAEGTQLGYRARGSSRLISVQECPVLEPSLQDALQDVAAWLRREPARTESIRAVTDGKQVLLTREVGCPPPPGARFRVGRPTDHLTVHDAVGDRTVAVGGFSQNHRAGNDAVLTTLQRWLHPADEAVDLYAGSGNWTRVLARIASRVLAIEHNARAAALIQRVVPQAEVWSTAVDPAALAAWRSTGRWVCVVNPPRSGLEPSVRQALCESRPDQLVYVSCDAATLARDARAFAESGLTMERLRAFDLYPQTSHLELVAAFRP
jgi:23S rRNA (uracil1939-C5)-methyltransferase